MSASQNPSSLLVELLTEELPPRALARLGDAFAGKIAEQLAARHLRPANAPWRMLATPRRLAIVAENVLAQAPQRTVREKIMPVAIALDEHGQPSLPLRKRLAAKGLDESVIADFERAQDGKAEAFFYVSTVAGDKLVDVLADIVSAAADALPVPKRMRWGAHETEFVRPVHGLAMLHGEQLVPGTVLGLQAGRQTQGHRFLASAAIDINSADSYQRQLLEEGHVIADFAARRDKISQQLQACAAQQEAHLAADIAALLDEVTALVEYPAVYAGEFEAEYLDVPQECLVLTMQTHQKYFPLFDARGRLKNRFLIVSNMAIDDPAQIIAGNQRVIRPRLADARFFYQQDQKHGLAAGLAKLDAVIYHNRLGSQGERVARLQQLAAHLAGQMALDPATAEHAARLCKADLVSEMVGEFPELQGTMGRYYATLANEPEAIAEAIEQHYRPRFAKDALPASALACALALADKIDTLTGFFAIGQTPTGERDPYALRRAAIGVLRILIEKNLALDLGDMIRQAHSGFASDVLEHSAADTASALLAFLHDRLRGLLRDAGHSSEVIAAVLAHAPTQLDTLNARLEAVAQFRTRAEARSLAAAHKRIVNLLRKNAPEQAASAAREHLQEAAEIALFEQTRALAPRIEADVAAQNYTAALSALASLHDAVDAFFKDVMVMAEAPQLRSNRLALLAELARLMDCVADLSCLSVPEKAT